MRKKSAWQRGMRAEKMCIWALRLKGYRIIHHRFKTKVGEVDIIAKRFQTLIFVEVKQRPTYKAAISSIATTQKRRIENTSQIFLKKNPKNRFKHIRFDVMLVSNNWWPKHIQSAWRLD